LAVWLRGKISAVSFVGYVVAQLIGALLAAAAVTYLKQGAVAALTPAVVSAGPAIVAEFLFTFALAFVVLNAATVSSVAGNSYYGLAIGFTVMTGAFAVGGISGGAFNPAVALGITVMHISAATNWWVLLAGELLGGAAAAGVFRALDLGDERKAR